MYLKKLSFKNAKNVFNSLLIAPPPTATRFSGFLGKNKKRGWTLAETLITLTIIGIVAAMTVPNLMQNWKKQVTLVKLKTAYSILNNAIKMSAAMNGPMPTWQSYIMEQEAGVPRSQAFAEKYFIPYVKVTGHAPYSDLTDYTILMLNGKTEENTNNKRYTVMLQNGMYITIGSGGVLQAFVVDLDGAKGANTYGKDVFRFNLNIMSADGFRTWQHNTTSCLSTTKNDEGKGCAYRIEQNGWEFPDNYPVKKW